MKIRPRNLIKALFFMLCCMLPLQPVFADSSDDTRNVTRGETVQRIVEHFDLKSRKQKFLLDCEAHLDECFFVFAAMSDYDDIAFDPLQLYPDVTPESDYYDAINTASMLGLVHGYLSEETTPFRPDNEITRIQALKIIFGAADLMKWKEKFELEDELGMKLTEGNWWYNRYLYFGIDNNIIPVRFYFEPDKPVTVAELELLLNNTQAYKSRYEFDAKTNTSGDHSDQAYAAAGEEV